MELSLALNWYSSVYEVTKCIKLVNLKATVCFPNKTIKFILSKLLLIPNFFSKAIYY